MKTDVLNATNLLKNGNPISANNVIQVSGLSNLPTPVGDVITLAGSTVYVFSGTVDIGANRFVLGVNTMLMGNHPALDTIVSTTTGDLITSTESNRIDNLSVICTSARVFNLSGGGAKNILCNFFIIKSCDTAGLIDSMALFSMNNCLLISYSVGGFSFTGTGALLRITAGTYNGSTGNIIDLGTALFDTVYLQNIKVNNSGTAVGIAVASNGANITANGFGILSGCFFEDTATAITGYTNFDIDWDVRDNASVELTSDRFQPTGWGNYADGETSPATLSVSTTPTKLLVDGTSSLSDYLPISIRGVSELWDTTTDKIIPITVGDSYDVRVNIEVTAKGGGASAINVILDIGGGGSPTINVVEAQIPITKSVPLTSIATFPIFTLATFIANGGQIFLSTDTGTATVGSRSITIIRTSSGAS